MFRSIYRPYDVKTGTGGFRDQQKGRPHTELLAAGISVVGPSWEEPVKYYYDPTGKKLYAPFSDFAEYYNIRAALLLSVRITPDLEAISKSKGIQIDCLRGFELARAHFYTTRVKGERILLDPHLNDRWFKPAYALHYSGLFNGPWAFISNILSAIGILGSAVPSCLDDEKGEAFYNTALAEITYQKWHHISEIPPRFAEGFRDALLAFTAAPFSLEAVEKAARILTPFTPPANSRPNRKGPNPLAKKAPPKQVRSGAGDGKDRRSFDHRQFLLRVDNKDHERRFYAGGPKPWGKMSVTRADLNKKLSGRLRAYRYRCTAEGAIPMRMDRRLSDGAIFKTRRHIPGGALLIDHSGSMGITPQDVEAVIRLLPAAKIAIYNGSAVKKAGTVNIVAQNGRYSEKLQRDHSGNVVDLPALDWLSRQEGPRIWVSDGLVTSEKEELVVENWRSCKRMLQRFGILWAYTLDETIKLARYLKIKGEDIDGVVGEVVESLIGVEVEE